MYVCLSFLLNKFVHGMGFLAKFLRHILGEFPRHQVMELQHGWPSVIFVRDQGRLQCIFMQLCISPFFFLSLSLPLSFSFLHTNDILIMPVHVYKQI